MFFLNSSCFSPSSLGVNNLMYFFMYATNCFLSKGGCSCKCHTSRVKSYYVALNSLQNVEKLVKLTWSLNVSTMSTTFTAWSSTPSSSPPPSADGFAPMLTSTAPLTTHYNPPMNSQRKLTYLKGFWTRNSKERKAKKITNLSLNFPQHPIMSFLVWKRVREKLIS